MTVDVHAIVHVPYGWCTWFMEVTIIDVRNKWWTWWLVYMIGGDHDGWCIWSRQAVAILSHHPISSTWQPLPLVFGIVSLHNFFSANYTTTLLAAWECECRKNWKMLTRVCHSSKVMAILLTKKENNMRCDSGFYLYDYVHRPSVTLSL